MAWHHGSKEYILNIATLVQTLVESDPNGVNGLASRLNVSAVTVFRWMAGSSRPRPSLEGRLRGYALQQHLFDDTSQTEPGGASYPSATEHQVRTAIGATLREIREILHRGGRLSTRHEALDEIAKLLFAHIVSIDTGGQGIGRHIIDGSSSPATALSGFVATSFRSFLPESLSVELCASDFELKLRSSEDKLSLELIDCLESKAPRKEILKAKGAGQLDILNEAFGQFLMDSFVDERELGQYLTPTEVVRTMVALGLDSLEDEVLDGLCSPDIARRPGVILDPSCGVGSFLAEVLRVLYSQAKARLLPLDLHQWVISLLRHNLIGIDKSERMIRLATANLALFGAPATNLHLANSLMRVGSDGELCESLVGRASLILTNPPFGAEFSGPDLLRYSIAQPRSFRSPRSVDSEILFLERYLDWLAPGGILVTIVPDSILTNRGLFSELRDIVSESAELLSVVSLPKVTFEMAGTSTKTSILHLRKSRARSEWKTFFSVCDNVGYGVTTKGSQRHRIAKDDGQLPQILKEATGKSLPKVGRWVMLNSDATRWDATYHAGLPHVVQRKLGEPNSDGLRLFEVAILSKERADPRRFGEDNFRYIEISDVDAKACIALHKMVQSTNAPSRARKVIRSGDVLVSTVRPERRTVGVVGEESDGGICSTGFAVLTPKGIDSYILARLLQSDFVNVQILRNNVGIAYPAIDEDCLTDLLLPISKHQLNPLAFYAREINEVRTKLREVEENLSYRLTEAITEWLDDEG